MECFAIAFKISGKRMLKNFIEIKELLARPVDLDSSVETYQYPQKIVIQVLLLSLAIACHLVDVMQSSHELLSLQTAGLIE